MSMRKLGPAIATALWLMYAPARATDCPSRDYLQYLEQAKSGAGRISLTFDYCAMRARADDQTPGTQLAVRCESQMRKITDALTKVSARPAIRFAVGGCQGDYPQPDIQKQ